MSHYNKHFPHVCIDTQRLLCIIFQQNRENIWNCKLYTSIGHFSLGYHSELESDLTSFLRCTQIFLEGIAVFLHPIVPPMCIHLSLAHLRCLTFSEF